MALKKDKGGNPLKPRISVNIYQMFEIPPTLKATKFILRYHSLMSITGHFEDNYPSQRQIRRFFSQKMTLIALHPDISQRFLYHFITVLTCTKTSSEATL